MHNDSDLLDRLLQTIESEILPLTENGVKTGNKIFGAALLRKNDLRTVLAETNNEMENPLWHGEMHLLKRFYELPAAERPPVEDLIFLSTHEPCSLCLSAITWAGFDNFYYFFSHEDSRDAFAIPHDLKILKAVFDLEPGAYQSHNEYWQAFHIKKMSDIKEPQFAARAKEIEQRYDGLSAIYQQSKQQNDIPLS